MAIIRLLTGTTDDYQAVEESLILDEREIAVEITTDSSGKKYFNIRQGDGVSTFFDLPIIVNNQRYEEIYAIISEYYDEILSFSSNMKEATDAANQSAQKATTAAVAAENAVKSIENLSKGMNSITDDITNKVYVFGIENGVVYIKDDEN